MRCAVAVPGLNYSDPELQEPLGAEAICGYLRQNGVECRIFDRRIGASPEDILRWRPDAVGISVMSEESLQDALRLVQKLKSPECVFFAGGLLVTTEEKRCRALFPEYVHLIPGEGEKSALELLTHGEPSCGMITPDEWAFASRDDLPVYLDRGGVINLRSARGCHGNCAFCTHSGGNEPKRGWEGRSVSLIADEIENLVRHGYPPIFNFTDDDFGDLDRAYRLNDELARRGMRIAYSAEFCPKTVLSASSEEIASLHQGGLRRVFTGLESMNPDTLKKWNKPVDPVALAGAVSNFRRAGVGCEVGYILFHGDTMPEDVYRETELLHEYGLFTPKAALSRMQLLPGSLLGRRHGITRKQPAALHPDTEEIYTDWQEKLKELFSLWGMCALRLPRSLSWSFLTGETAGTEVLLSCMEQINEAAYRRITAGTLPDLDALRIRADQAIKENIR